MIDHATAPRGSRNGHTQAEAASTPRTTATPSWIQTSATPLQVVALNSPPKATTRVSNNEATTSSPHGTEPSYAAAAPPKGRPSARRDADDVPVEVRAPWASPQGLGTGAEMPSLPGLPIPVPPDAVRRAGPRCVVTPVDRDGRLADRSVLKHMGWFAEQAVELAIEAGPIVVARPGGSVRINTRGHLRLPLTVRRTCGIGIGDRVLVVANQRRGELLVIPAATVDDMVAAHRQSHDSRAGR